MRFVPTVVAIIILAISGTLVVTQKLQITQAGYDLGRLNAESQNLKEQTRLYKAELSKATSMGGIADRVEAMQLPLIPPTADDSGTVNG